MIDTIALQWSSVDIGPPLESFIRGHYPAALDSTSAHSREQPWRAWRLKDPVLGTVNVKSSEVGDFLTVETSLPKFLTGDNCRQITHREVMGGLPQFMAGVEGWFGDFLPPGVRSTVKLMRLDTYHQRPMPPGTIAHVADCLKTRGKRVPAVHKGQTVTYHQSAERRVRFYDKGLESGNEQYIGTIRHEEQMRGKAARALLDPVAMTLDPEKVREAMNRRFEGWPSTVVEDTGLRWLASQGHAGAIAIALSTSPELAEVFRPRSGVSGACGKNTFYKAQELLREANRRRCSVDLRIPEGAWQGDNPE